MIIMQEKQQQQQQAKRRRAPVPVPKPVKTYTEFNNQLLFGKYSYSEIEVKDPSLKSYINLKPLVQPSTFRNNSKKMFSKAEISVVERLVNSLMRGGTGKKVGGHVIRTEGRLQGKKLKVIHIVNEAFAIVQNKTNSNPIQILVTALENSAPIEDTTRIRQGGTTSTISVDISASRRLDIALKNVALASIIGAFNKKKRSAEALADELMMAARGDVNSYAIRIKNDKDRMAKSAR